MISNDNVLNTLRGNMLKINFIFMSNLFWPFHFTEILMLVRVLSYKDLEGLNISEDHV